MKLSMILIVGAIMFVIAIIINVLAFVLEKKYKNKMSSFAKKN